MDYREAAVNGDLCYSFLFHGFVQNKYMTHWYEKIYLAVFYFDLMFFQTMFRHREGLDVLESRIVSFHML